MDFGFYVVVYIFAAAVRYDEKITLGATSCVEFNYLWVLLIIVESNRHFEFETICFYFVFRNTIYITIRTYER